MDLQTESNLRRSLRRWKLAACLLLVALALAALTIYSAGGAIARQKEQLDSSARTLNQETAVLRACNDDLEAMHSAVNRAIAQAGEQQAAAEDEAQAEAQQRAARRAAALRLLLSIAR